MAGYSQPHARVGWVERRRKKNRVRKMSFKFRRESIDRAHTSETQHIHLTRGAEDESVIH